jgi:predicted GH43/DUF377 family glycosyl hydrolase
MAAETMVDSRQELLRRHTANPLLKSSQWPYPVNTVFNAGAVMLPTGETLLLCRVEERSGRSHLCTARSADGVTDWQIDPAPTLEPDDEQHREEHWGIEDPRIVYLQELGRYAVTYTGFARRGPLVCLALTDDFRTFERVGAILPPENKDAALLPRKIDGRWAMIHRPVPTMGRPSLWISFSPDLRHWGDHALIFEPRHGPWWDANKIGLSPPPIETDKGWLVLYHGVKTLTSMPLYRMGLALLDRADPRVCICRSHEWIFTPDPAYERVGDVPNVAFSCGCTVGGDGDTLNLYYGAADTSMCLATGSISAMLAWLEEHRQ